MNEKKSMLLTGATGILGGWVLAEALHRGFRPFALMRDATPEAARARLREVMALADAPAGPEAVEILHGDIRRPAFGVDEATRARVCGEIDFVIHCAASVSFDPNQGDQTWDTNVNGLKNALSFVGDSGVPLYHVSTAYVSGTRVDHVLEDELDVGQNFHNAYERSKFECEMIMREALASGRVRGGVYRPAIIIGAASNGRIASFYNFYGLLRLIDSVLSGKLDGGGQAVRMPIRPENTKNLVPVDWCARAMWEGILRDGPTGLTYHLTNPDPPTQREIMGWANELLEPANLRVEVVGAISQESTSPIEQVTAFWLRHYESYLEEEPTFDRANLDRATAGAAPFPKIDLEFVKQLLAYARSEQWIGLFSSKRQQPRTETATTSIEEEVVNAEVAGRTVF